MLDQRPAAVHIQDLQSVTDGQHRLPHVVSILQKQLIDGVAFGIGRSGFGIALGAVLGGINVGPAAGQQDAVAMRNQLHGLGGRLAEGNADRQASRVCDRLFVLRERAIGVVRVIGLRDRDGDSWG